MKGILQLVFATLILSAASFALGEPIYPNPKTNVPQNGEPTNPPESTVPLQQVDVGQPPPQPPAGTYFYKYGQSISVNLGGYFAAPAGGGVLSYGDLTATYLWDSLTRTHFESGVELLTFAEGHLWTAYRVNYDFTDKLRPFTSFGIGVRIIPQNGLATFLTGADYFVRGAVGSEYSLTETFSLRGEIYAGIDLQANTLFSAIVGASYGF